MKFKLLFRKEKKGGEKEKTWFSENDVGELTIDAYETPEELVIQSPIAGITSKDVKISLEDDMLVIRGKREKPETSEKGKKKYFYQECFWGKFEKRLILPEEVDINKAKANIKNGILTLRIPKKKKKGKKEVRIEIQSE
jgi:HSP20 family protein